MLEKKVVKKLEVSVYKQYRRTVRSDSKGRASSRSAVCTRPLLARTLHRVLSVLNLAPRLVVQMHETVYHLSLRREIVFEAALGHPSVADRTDFGL